METIPMLQSVSDLVSNIPGVVELMLIVLLVASLFGGFILVDWLVGSGVEYTLPDIEVPDAKNPPRIIHLAVLWGIKGKSVAHVKALVKSLSVSDQRNLLCEAAYHIVIHNKPVDLASYELLLRMLRQKDRVLGPQLIDQMSAKGIEVKPQHYQPLLRFALNSRRGDQVAAVMESTSRLGESAEELLVPLREKDRITVYENWPCRPPLTERGYGLMISAYSKDETKYECVDEIVDQMESEGKSLSMSVFTAYISTLRARRQWGKVQEALLKIDETTLDTAGIIGLCRICDEVNDSDRVKRMVELASSCTYDGHACCAIVVALGKVQAFDEIRNLLAVMRTKIDASQWTAAYNATVTAFAKAGRCQDALATLQELHDVGGTADVITYSASINACARAHDCHKALELLEEMQTKGIEPNLITYNSTITACEKAKQPELALQVVEMVRQSPIQPDAITFNAAIAACAHGGQWEEGLQLKDEMQKEGFRLSEMTYSSLMKCFGGAGNYIRALDILDEMKESNVSPDRACYNYALHSCFAGNMHAKAREIMDQMAARHVLPDTASYFGMLKSYMAAGDYRQMRALWYDMSRQRVVPDLNCCAIMLRVYADEVDRQGIIEVLDEMKARNVRMTQKCYELAVRGLEAHGYGCSHELLDGFRPRRYGSFE